MNLIKLEIFCIMCLLGIAMSGYAVEYRGHGGRAMISTTPTVIVVDEVPIYPVVIRDHRYYNSRRVIYHSPPYISRHYRISHDYRRCGNSRGRR